MGRKIIVFFVEMTAPIPLSRRNKIISSFLESSSFNVIVSSFLRKNYYFPINTMVRR